MMAKHVHLVLEIAEHARLQKSIVEIIPVIMARIVIHVEQIAQNALQYVEMEHVILIMASHVRYVHTIVESVHDVGTEYAEMEKIVEIA